MKMKITYAERHSQEDKHQVQIFLNTWHVMTIYHKPGSVSIESYPTDPDGVFRMLKTGEGIDSSVYAVAAARSEPGTQLSLTAFSNEGSHTCWVPEEDLHLISEDKILSWDLKRFREYADDMGY